MKILLKRAYDPVSPSDGTRILVDRLWPRGVKKETLKLTCWLKEIGPSTALRQWFAHDPEKWVEFQRRYVEELQVKKKALQPILKALQTGTVTLVYGAKDPVHNNAVCLKKFIEDLMS